MLYQMPLAQLKDLPGEILRGICFAVDWNDALSLQATSRRFADVASEPLLWRHYCETCFKHWSASHHISAKLGDSSFLDWKRLFRKRHEAQVEAISTLEKITSSQKARTPKIEAIIALGYDSKDALLQSHVRALDSHDHLARRYWSHVALGCLHRSLALEEWAAVKSGARRDASLERPVGAFDLFILDEAPEGDMDAILHRLNDYVAQLLCAHPEIEDQTPRQKASTTAEFLISNGLVSIREGREYHNIEHGFLGRALFSQEKNSLPMITVIIYCYILRQLGLSAAPCDFPFHVHAIVQPPSGLDLEGAPLSSDVSQIPSLYMDPFRTSDPVPISSLHQQINFLAPMSNSIEHTTFLAPSNAHEVTIRCARNILNAVQRSAEPHSGWPIDVFSAQYAALWALLILPENFNPMHYHLLMHLFAQSFQHDVALIEKHILPRTGGRASEYAQMWRSVRLADLNAPTTVKRRSGDPDAESVKFKVGEVFVHKRYSYTAVVTGWDARCDANEDWIQRMGVDALDRGRRQAFYHAFVQDKSLRYVAEENINPSPGEEVVPDEFPIEIGKWFKRWDDVQKVFVSNIKDEYPDD